MKSKEKFVLKETTGIRFHSTFDLLNMIIHSLLFGLWWWTFLFRYLQKFRENIKMTGRVLVHISLSKSDLPTTSQLNSVRCDGRENLIVQRVLRLSGFDWKINTFITREVKYLIPLFIHSLWSLILIQSRFRYKKRDF